MQCTLFKGEQRPTCTDGRVTMSGLAAKKSNDSFKIGMKSCF